MKKLLSPLMLLALLGLIVMPVVACAPADDDTTVEESAEDATDEMEESTDEMGDEMEEMGDEMEEAGDEMEAEGEAAMEEMEEGAEEMGDDMEAAGEEMEEDAEAAMDEMDDDGESSAHPHRRSSQIALQTGRCRKRGVSPFSRSARFPIQGVATSSSSRWRSQASSSSFTVWPMPG